MSFQKMNFCRSTEVAFNIFHMFRNNTVNLVRPDPFEDKWVQYEDASYPLEEGELKPYDNDSLEFISELLRGECSEVRVHDMETSGPHYAPQESRYVQFIVKTREFGKVIFAVTVGDEFIDGDEVSGWTPWQMDQVTVQTFGKTKYQFRLAPLRVRVRDTENHLSAQMKENIGHPVSFGKF